MSIAPLAAVGPADSKLLEGLLDKIRQHDQSRVGEIRALRQQVEQLSSELARKNTAIKQLKAQLLQLSEFKRSIVQSINRGPAAAADFLAIGDDDLPSAVGTSGASGASSGFDFGLYQPGTSGDNAYGAPEYPHSAGLGGLGEEGDLTLSAETTKILAEIDRATDPFSTGATSPAFAGFGSATKQPLSQPQPFLRGSGLGGTNPFGTGSSAAGLGPNPGAPGDFRFSQATASGSAPRTAAVSPGRLRSSTAPALQPPPAANAGAGRPGSPALSTRAPSTVPPPPPPSQANGGISSSAGTSGAPDMEGHEFFMTAKKQLSFQQFQQFLGIIKQFNQHERNKEQTLSAAREVFGPQHEALYKSFYALLTRAAIPA